jgi:hypothetical protein
VIVKLLIPATAKRSSDFGRKCRAEFAEVLEVKGAEVGISLNSNYPAVEYKAGETVKPLNGFSDDWQKECASGIHFFITEAEAKAFKI